MESTLYRLHWHCGCSYIGVTVDLPRRLGQHARKPHNPYVRDHGPDFNHEVLGSYDLRQHAEQEEFDAMDTYAPVCNVLGVSHSQHCPSIGPMADIFEQIRFTLSYSDVKWLRQASLPRRITVAGTQYRRLLPGNVGRAIAFTPLRSRVIAPVYASRALTLAAQFRERPYGALFQYLKGA